MVKLLKALPALLLAAFAVADSGLQITSPSQDIWWVAKSTNVMAWTCQSAQGLSASNFTVLINNSNPATLQGPLAFIAIQQNYQCSITVSQDQVSQPPAAGYTLIFANPLNNTDVYATSQSFEIKPLGSLYPSQVSSSISAASGTGSSSSPSASPTKAGALSAHTPNFVGLAGVMGLLAVGLLGA